MKSKRDLEGYLFIDSRHGPITPEALAYAGLPQDAGRGVYEAPTYTCSHCCTVVYMNPKRTRDREYCRKCDHYICDTCGTAKKHGAECKTFKQLSDEIMEATVKQGDHEPRILLP
jgi:hypothetical protein